ncbi:hypothetical protein A1O3_03720 [Capronia epimyces CBS 606.96]|uniref:Carboxylic ester hydrolase n=1 Tax=Capronia epimyces CBS 606.96 TaxID=1182542 RepID=W9YBX3_9EURO|nr:uncharacterized protein A1O3_03720 [Capronia epimyces CBS 606.96]EXJ86766.1 hypothetical protein A1O3_03720 [Capronia epimyces CBS 606.96]
MTKTNDFRHATLGVIKVIEEDGVIVFRGLKYATLNHGFAEPELYGYGQQAAEDGVVDATRSGPSAVSPPVACDLELSLIQKSLAHGKFETSVTDCLNLNLYLPTPTQQSQSEFRPLPVFVFIHGGGFMLGSNAWPQYDLTRIVSLSKQLQKPVIGVQVNYRLGAYGFLDSSSLREAGVKANRGLRDQRTALLWIRQNIAGFGGDPEQVTVIGESAGGVSCTLHLLSKEPLFKQLVAMSGNSLLMKPLPLPVAEGTYSQLASALNIATTKSPSDQLNALLAVDPDTVLASVGPSMPLLPVLDGDVVTSSVDFAQWTAPNIAAQVPGTQWCRRLMLGDCQFDGSIFILALQSRKTDIAASFARSLTTDLKDSPDVVEAILASYNINPRSNSPTSTSDDEAMNNILRFMTDVRFYASTLTIARAWPQSAFVYHFNEPNPWDGPYRGESTHILDVAFLFQNFNDYLSPEQQTSAQRFASDVIAFVHGDDPYQKHSADTGGARVYGPPCTGEDVYVQSLDPRAYGRRDTVWKLAARVGMDRLAAALDGFMARPGS